MTVRTTAVLASTAAIVALAGCGGGSAPPAGEKPLPPVNPQAASLREGFSTMERLADTAKHEGSLTVIGLPHDWVNYGHVIAAFTDRYGIKVTELEPDAGSQREIDAAVRAAKSRDAATTPDVFDLSLDVAVANAAMFAPYRVRTWQDIPDELKDHQAAWYAGYGGYMSIGYDPRKVPAPATFADLLKPGYTVALPGSPLQTASAFNGVMAASLLKGSAEAERGVRFFASLKEAGNLITTAKPVKPPTAVVDWDYLNAERASREGEGWKVTIPRDAALTSYYVQAINKRAAHPAAARLWQEFLFSDEGQNLFLAGFARPARLEALQMRGTVDREAEAKLPQAPPGRPAQLTIPQTDAAKTYLRRAWPKQIG
ncbi:ABC transporter substrate-binding protein [Spongiactinospora sp. TRM90649]|uniref:ABC transporter substrate-binding protein n=1 Tax=Spongiactinospora sp. TRM90649 TaxID=3031114 RepID=UPI0023F66297|nr:ABC transporter substrate-binding protein [Spongiactinospora sp. TRM90649]MDF5755439.1 extracellular solute-binding protein [Spongiactinospora sp. TRM90649]